MIIYVHCIKTYKDKKWLRDLVWAQTWQVLVDDVQKVACASDAPLALLLFGAEGVSDISGRKRPMSVDP